MPSDWWKLFIKKEKNVGICKLCNASVKTSGNTTNLKIHYMRKHKPKETKAKETPQPSSSREPECVAEAISVGPQTSSSMIDTNKETITQCFSTMKSYSQGGSKDAQITEAIAHMIVSDNLTLNTTEKPGFAKLMKIICPLYHLPSKKSMTQVIDNKYEAVKVEVVKLLEKAQNVTITCDTWTETMNTRSFLGVTAHFLIGWKSHKVNLAVEELKERHTSSYLEERLMTVLNDWGISKVKVLAAVTDNGANIKKAIHDLFGKEKHIACVAHTLNLVASAALEGMATLLNAVKAIVTFFKQSTNAAEELRRAQGENALSLKNSVPTRWNSTFYMLERFVQLRHLVGTILLNYTNSPRMISANELAVIQEMLLLLKPLESATRDICGDDYVTSSRVIPLVNCLKLKIEKVVLQTSAVSDMKLKLLAEIDKRLAPYEDHILLGVATIVDPRFKTLHFRNAIAKSRCINKISDILKEVTTAEGMSTCSEESDPDSDSIWDMHQELKRKNREKMAGDSSTSSAKDSMPLELKHYMANVTTDIKSDPLQYWDQHSTSPMNIVALKYLSSIATSVPSERLFSKANIVISELRNRLNPQRLSRILFLKSVEWL